MVIGRLEEYNIALHERHNITACLCDKLFATLLELQEHAKKEGEFSKEQKKRWLITGNISRQLKGVDLFQSRAESS